MELATAERVEARASNQRAPVQLSALLFTNIPAATNYYAHPAKPHAKPYTPLVRAVINLTLFPEQNQQQHI
jgi:hypothetical protein